MFKNLDIDKFFETLSEEDKIDFMYYCIDIYEDKNFLIKHKDYSRKAIDKALNRNKELGGLKEDDYFNEKILNFKKLRENKISRILNK